MAPPLLQEQSHGTGAPAQIGLKVEELEHALRRRGPDQLGAVSFTVSHESGDKASAEVEMQFLGSVLQLRGLNDVQQPLQDPAGNVLLFNGELYEGISLDSDDNDAEVLLRRLGDCCPCLCPVDLQMNPWQEVQRDQQGMEIDASDSTVDRRSDVPGRLPQQASKSGAAESPSALALEQDQGAVASRCFVHGETEGRALPNQLGSCKCGRSNSTSSIVQLLSHLRDQRFILSSVAPIPHSSNATSDSPAEQSPMAVPQGSQQPLSSIPDFWEDLPCTVHSISFLSEHSAAVQIKAGDRCTSGSLSAGPSHITADWTGHAERSVDITPAELDPCSERNAQSPRYLTQSRRHAWQDPLLQRLILYQRPSDSQIAGSLDLPCNNEIVTHSQGVVDSASTSVMDTSVERLLVALNSIDLINVSFDLELAPDHISAVEGLKELQQLSPMRRWHLVQVNGSLEELNTHQHHLRSLLCPASTYMDLNIGTALWLASRGKGDLHPCSTSGAAAVSTSQEGQCQDITATSLDNSSRPEDDLKAQEDYTSMARALLVGAGADEQCAGYGRHRTRFRTAGWKGLEEELRADVQRLWRRNLGRDDRCIADNGKEARYPYLDEKVMSLILDMPLHHIANLQLPLGVGDKLILRKVASKLGLHRAAALPKRAIQFGSRIARQSNLRDFGSNRAANAAGAGSVKFPALPRASCNGEL
eukprot:SM000210S06752  [mRNA]  locus=s210:218869:223086:- [translate_table: standard]